MKRDPASFKEQEIRKPHTKLLKLEEGNPSAKYNPH